MILHEQGNWGRRFPLVCWFRAPTQTPGDGGGGGAPSDPNQPRTTPNPGFTNIYLFGNIDYGGNFEILSTVSMDQIYLPADYTPFFQDFNDEVSSAIIEPADIYYTNGVTLILFEDADFKNIYDARYFSSLYPPNNPSPKNERKIENFGQFDRQTSSALVIQHPQKGAPLAVSLNSIFPSKIQPVITTALYNFANPGKPYIVHIYGPLGHKIEKLTINSVKQNAASLQFGIDPSVNPGSVQPDLTVIKLELQLIFDHASPDIKFNLYLNIHFSLLTNTTGQYVTASLNSFSLPLDEFSNWGIFVGFQQELYGHIFDAINGFIFSAVDSFTPINVTNQYIKFGGVYTIPYPVIPGQQATAASPPPRGYVNDAWTTEVLSILNTSQNGSSIPPTSPNYIPAVCYYFNYDYFNDNSAATDILLVLWIS